MDATRWQEIEPILDHILDLGTVERDAYLDKACALDPELRLEVEKLLDECLVADGLLDAETLDLAKENALNKTFEESLIGRRFGAFETTEVLGRGGMGTVLAAHRADGHFDQDVALKVVSPRRLGKDAVERFRFERQILADLKHPSIAGLLDGGVSDDGMPFLVMERVDGSPLDAHMRRQGLDLNARLRLLIEVCDAIEHAHRRRVVHLDLKPSNILVTDESRPKVLDFGIAQMLDRRSGASASGTSGRMTPHFAAPEQLRGENVTSLCDIYSLGVLLYLAITDELPRQRRPDESVEAFVDRLGREEAPTPSTARSLERGDEMDAVTAKALHRNPKMRYGSPAELADDLRRLLDHQPVRALEPRPTYLWRKHVRRHRAAWTAGILILVAGLGLAYGWWQDRRLSEEKLRITRVFTREAEGIESFLRYAYALPAHDVRREKELSYKRMEQIRDRMATLGSIAQAPGHLALGRAELMLNRPEAARRHLEEAWNLGLNDSESAFLLGKSLGRIYASKRNAALEIRDSTMRRLEIERLQEELRDPALELLMQVDDISEISSPALVATMIALLEERNDEALELAQQAEVETPWLPDPFELRGQAWLQIAQEHVTESRWDETRSALSEAVSALEQGAALAPSSTELAHRLCEAHVLGVAPDQLSRRPQNQTEGRRACAAAEALDPDLPHPKRLSARLRILAMQDPSRPLDERLADLDVGIVMAEGILKLQDVDGHASNLLGTGFLTRAVFLSRAKGLDPRPDLVRAAEALGQAVEAEPGLLAAHINRGTALAILAQEKLARGEDPDPSFEAATESFQQALDRSPEHGPLLGNLGNLLYNRAVHRLEQGLESQSVLERALAINARSLEAGPGLVTVQNLRSAIMETMATVAIVRGEPVDRWIEEGRQAVESTLEINPDYALAWVNASALSLAEAKAALRTGLDPNDALNRALEEIQKARSLGDPVNEALESNHCEVLLLAARSAGLHGLPVETRVESRLQAFAASFPDSAWQRARRIERALLDLRFGSGKETLRIARRLTKELLSSRPGHALGTLLKVEVELWAKALGHGADGGALQEALSVLESKPVIDTAELGALERLARDPAGAIESIDAVPSSLRRHELELLRQALMKAPGAAGLEP